MIRIRGFWAESQGSEAYRRFGWNSLVTKKRGGEKPPRYCFRLGVNPRKNQNSMRKVSSISRGVYIYTLFVLVTAPKPLALVPVPVFGT